MRCLWLAMALLWPVVTAAQPMLPGRVEAALGGRWDEGVNLGTRDAVLTRPDDGQFTAFTTESELGPAPLLEGRLGVRLTGTLHVEGVVTYGTVDLRSRLSGDVEGIPALTVSAPITQLTVQVAFVEYLPGIAIGERAIPFVDIGGGFSRQLYDERALAETGGLGHLGGGLALLTMSRENAGLKAVGLRLEVRMLFRKGGVAFEEGITASPSLGASVFFRF